MKNEEWLAPLGLLASYSFLYPPVTRLTQWRAFEDRCRGALFDFLFYAFVAYHEDAVVVDEDSSASFVLVILEIIDIDGDDSAFIEALDVLEDGVTHEDAIDVIAIEDHVERVAWEM